LKLRPDCRREVVLVEGLLDVHHLRAKGFTQIAAIGGARAQPSLGAQLRGLGFESTVLAFDNDQPGREGLSRAIEDMSRARVGPRIRVVEPRLLGNAKDPDAFVRDHGVEKFCHLVERAACGVSWRALDLTRGLSDRDSAPERRAALGHAGAWLGSLPARLSLEQEDAIHLVAERCGYSVAAVQRAFRARFWEATPDRTHIREGIER
jgi:hypothetical protein